jgi:hypothetical protein
MLLKMFGATVCLVAVLHGQAPADGRATGTVTKLDADARALTIKADTGQETAVTLAPNARFRRVAPGETDLKNAATVALSDISVGDRVLASGKGDAQSLSATLVVVMSQGDIKKKQAAEQADWDRRGMAGLAAAAGSDTVTLDTRTLAGSKQVVVVPGPNVVIRRYAPDSVKFSDAKPAKLSEIRPKDQVKVRGDKQDDGAKVLAEEIVFGTFKTSAGVILSIDTAANEIRMNDLETKKPVVVKISPDSSVRKLQPQMAQRIAVQVHGGAAGGGDGTPAAGGGPAGAGREGGRGPGGQGGPGGGQGGPGGQGGGPGGFQGRGGPGGGGPGGGGPGGGGGFGGRGGAGDLSQMLERSPAATLADLKAGDAIVVLSTEGATQGKITAITMLAGVEPILTQPGSREMSLGGWTLDAGGGGGGGQ